MCSWWFCNKISLRDSRLPVRRLVFSIPGQAGDQFYSARDMKRSDGNIADSRHRFLFDVSQRTSLIVFLSPKVAAAVAAGAVGAIRIGQPGRLVRQGQEQEPPLACLNAALTKNTLKVDVCALSTDVAYNRCVLWQDVLAGSCGAHVGW